MRDHIVYSSCKLEVRVVEYTTLTTATTFLNGQNESLQLVQGEIASNPPSFHATCRGVFLSLSVVGSHTLEEPSGRKSDSVWTL